MAKIGIDCRFYSENFGIGRYIIALIQNLQKIDHANEYVLFLNENGYQNLILSANNFTKVLCPEKHYSLAEQTTFLTRTLKHKLDLLHLTNFNGPVLYPKKTVITIHDLTLHYYQGNKQNSWLHRLGYQVNFGINTWKAKQIITVSQTTKNNLLQLHPGYKNKTTPILLGLDNHFLNSQENTTKITSFQLPKSYLLYCGNWREHKNVVNLLKAFVVLKQQYKYPGKLVITGKQQPDYPNLQTIAANLKITNQVLFPGYVPSDEVPLLFKHAQAYILPSFMEGFGLPILEATQTKTPVACSKIPALEEVSGGHAIFFDPHSPADMAKQINRLITDPQLQKDLVTKATTHLKNFSYQKMTEKTHKMYLNALND